MSTDKKPLSGTAKAAQKETSQKDLQAPKPTPATVSASDPPPEAEHPAKEDKTGTPEQPAAKTGKAKSAGVNPTQPTAAPKQQAKDPLEALVAQYAKVYPQNKTFHITSDRQVFLENNLCDAQAHQKTLTQGEELKTIKVK